MREIVIRQPTVALLCVRLGFFVLGNFYAGETMQRLKKETSM